MQSAGALGLATWEVISIMGLHQQKGLLLSVFLSTATAIVGFGNVVVESFLSDANMTALTYLSVVFAASESPSGACLLPPAVPVSSCMSRPLASPWAMSGAASEKSCKVNPTWGCSCVYVYAAWAALHVCWAALCTLCR